jgi:hypothetical protein
VELPILTLNATYEADCRRAGQMTVPDALSEWPTTRPQSPHSVRAAPLSGSVSLNPDFSFRHVNSNWSPKLASALFAGGDHVSVASWCFLPVCEFSGALYS